MAAGCTVVAQAERGHAAERVRAGGDLRGGGRARRACSTSSPATARWSARRSPPTRGWTWSRSPARPRAGRRVSELAAATRQAGGARARRQVAERDPRRRRPREGGRRTAIQKCFLNSGQTCSALTRMLVPRDAARRGRADRRRRPRRPSVGDPFDEATRLGPLVSEAPARARARLHPQGIEEGAEARARRRRAAGGPRHGLLRRSRRCSARSRRR